ncbi:MAG: hypothetical protein IJ063_03015 [Ruminococcus sp.]|nr:hypothetical protein [Ruminococcus sp.]
MPINRRHRREVILGVSAVIFAGLFKLILDTTEFSYHCLLSLLLLTIYLVWLFASRRRFPQRGMRRLMTASAVLMMLWNIVKTIRYEFIPADSFISRQIWYWYYFPVVMLPILLLMTTFYLGRTDGYELPRKALLAFIPAVLVTAGIVTNDYHQLAFRFDGGVPDTSDSYSYGVLYFSAMGILVICVAGILFKTLRSCTKSQFSRSFLLPAAISALGGLYFFSYNNSGEPTLFQRMYEFPDLTCLFFVCFWESLVITRMLPSNADHEEFFRASSISAGLADNDLNIVLHGENSPVPEKDQLIEAEEGEVINEGRQLKVQPVAGGYFYWLEDIRELQRLNLQLEETGNYLEEENAMLDEASKLEEGRRRTAEQNKLYDSISQRLKPRFDSLSAKLEKLPADEEGFREGMKRAAIDGVFIKRCSNLLLLAGSSSVIDSGELALSVNESLGYLGLSGIFGHADIPVGTEMAADEVLFCYELFQQAIENALPELNAVMVTLKTGSTRKFLIELDNESQPDLSGFYKRGALLGGKLDTEVSDGSCFITFTREGGED